jgi:hypothetical protein
VEATLQQVFLFRALALQRPQAGAVGEGLQALQLGDLGTRVGEGLQSLQGACGQAGTATGGVDLGGVIAAVAPLGGQGFLPLGSGGMDGGGGLDHGTTTDRSIVGEGAEN